MRFFCFFLVFIFPLTSFAAPLTKAELFALYVRTVSDTTIAQRMDQLYTNLPAGAFKDQAKAALMQDLLDAIGAKINAANSKIDGIGLRATENQSTITTDVLGPLTDTQTSVNDTTLP